MRGHFSIEWMAQSSQAAGPDRLPGPVPGPVPVPAACGTHSESLPGFYCRLKSETEPQPEETRINQTSSHPVTEVGFSSGTEEETSGYESEGGHSSQLSPPAPADGSPSPPASPPPGRRPRTAFTAEQISSMERAFKRNAYLGTQDKAELCRKLHLSDKQIRNWFQNRRMKLKRTVQDALAHACQASVASQLMQYPELQAYRPAPYPRYHAAPEGPASYVHPHGLQYGSGLPLDSFYQYGSLPGVLLPSYPTYPQYY